MSLMIESMDELFVLLGKLGLKVTNVEELRDLLTMINAQYNPEAARVRLAKQVGVTVPCGLGIVAGIVTGILTTSAGNSVLVSPHLLGALAWIWGAVGVVSVSALFSGLMLGLRRGPRGWTDQPPSILDERVTAALKRDPTV